MTDATTNLAKMTHGPVRAHLVALTVPMIWGILAMMMFNVADTWFVAQLGETHLAAMSFTFPVIMVLISLGIGLMAGTASVLSRVIGAGDKKLVQQLTTDAALLSLLLSLIFTVIGLLTIDPLFRLLGADDEVLPLISDYMVVWYGGFVVFLVPMVGLGAVRATGDSKLQGRIMVASAIINLILDPLLIFGWFGFPRLEIQGAAIASVVARAMTFVVGFWALHYQKRMLTYEWPTLPRIIDSWKQVLHVGLPAAGTNMIIPLAIGVITAMIARHGAEAVAGFGAATRIEQVTLVVFFAMSATIGPFMGQNLGAGKPERIVEAYRLTIKFCLWFGLLIALVLALGARFLMRQFSDDEQVIAVGVAFLWIVPISFGAQGIVMIINAAFNGLGRPLPAVVISVARMVGLYLPLAVIGSYWLDVHGIFVAASLANISAAALAFIWFRNTCAGSKSPRMNRDIDTD